MNLSVATSSARFILIVILGTERVSYGTRSGYPCLSVAAHCTCGPAETPESNAPASAPPGVDSLDAKIVQLSQPGTTVEKAIELWEEDTPGTGEH